ncbi:hypothetical protein FOMPIDRAFT_1137627 [Fomitopsis schrenkii]|uniref:SUN domain-containing protein n=1 Tax=Fomitopsis schrenkii TaxID=2126942 RepID=S8DG49_FOMSC|nr:hypothetical protein FOMPIDRAFT_1137627 [Fomitopsis schrenkii]
MSLLVIQALCRYDACAIDTLQALLPSFANGAPPWGRHLAPVTREELEERLLRVAHDDLGYRDFAGYAAGGRPIEGLTSPTWDGPGPLGASELPDVLRGKQARGPIWALKRDIQQGSCWPMAGTAGYLGIQLAEPVIVTNVTVDHLPASLASETRSAPHHIRVWALIPTSPRTQLIHVADLEYDIRSTQHIQNFPTSGYAPTVSVDKVVFQILDNWGLPDFTCIYRVRVHGRAAE